MDEQKIIEATEAYIRRLFEDNSDGHDDNHTLRVRTLALRIAASHPEADLFVIEMAALLHDADDHKLFPASPGDPECPNARRFMACHDIGTDTIDEICRSISSVSFSRNRANKPPSIEAAIVQDADRLDATGAIAIARTFAYGGSRNRPLAESAEHLREKCMTLASAMNTPEAHEMAQSRHAFLAAFLDELDAEADGLL